uniref:NADH-ubiquinone oxidoreductase ESSS subunit n=1 Tax=Lactuca sativa TaxID=4236 RepID=A0A9R1VA94_LACSA|nr:hypothetical protein LSAT_V11C500288460 [Lactuca sativa]
MIFSERIRKGDKPRLKRRRIGRGKWDPINKTDSEFSTVGLFSKIIIEMPSAKPFSAAAGMLRSRLTSALRQRGGDTTSRWTTPGHQERPNGYFLNRTPLPPGQSRKWEDWELPCYVTSFLTIVILGVGLNAKPDLTLETWARQKAIERLASQKQIVAVSTSDESD